MNSRAVYELETSRSSLDRAIRSDKDMPAKEWAKLTNIIGQIDTLISDYWSNYNASL